MTASSAKPPRSEPEAEPNGPGIASVLAAGPGGTGQPAAGLHRRKPSRSEPEEEPEPVEYTDDHAPEVQRLQEFKTNDEGIPSKVAIPEDFYHKKWYNANDVYKQLDAARVEMAIDEDTIPAQGAVLLEYSGAKSSRPMLGSKPDRSEMRDPSDPVKVYVREMDSSHKPSRSEAE